MKDIIMEKLISEYYSDDMKLKSVVYMVDKVAGVKYYRDNLLIDSQTYPHNSIHYAEDAAENYVMGILKL